MLPVSLIWHSKEVVHFSFFLRLVLKNIPGGCLSPYVCLNLPLQLSRWVFFRHTISKANFHLLWQSRPHDKASERYTGPEAHLREKLTNRTGDVSSTDNQKVKGPSKISCEVETQSPDPVEANRYCPVNFPESSTSLIPDLYGNSGIPSPHEVMKHSNVANIHQKELYLQKAHLVSKT